MKIITSPAKLMNIEASSPYLKMTQPHFIEEAELIQETLKQKSPKYLSDLMEISSKLADENWERNQNWKAKPFAKESAPALMAFAGEVYRGLDAKTLDEKSVKYLQKNYRILSGFDFYNYREGKLAQIVVYTKHARGLVARFCAENNVQTLDEVKAFNLENYYLAEDLSTENKLVFTR